MNTLLDSFKPFDHALADKGHPIDKRVAVLDVCNAAVASQLLALDAAISLALRCRVAVFEHADGTRLRTITPTTI